MESKIDSIIGNLYDNVIPEHLKQIDSCHLYQWLYKVQSIKSQVRTDEINHCEKMYQKALERNDGSAFVLLYVFCNFFIRERFVYQDDFKLKGQRAEWRNSGRRISKTETLDGVTTEVKSEFTSDEIHHCTYGIDAKLVDTIWRSPEKARQEGIINKILEINDVAIKIQAWLTQDQPCYLKLEPIDKIKQLVHICHLEDQTWMPEFDPLIMVCIYDVMFRQEKTHFLRGIYLKIPYNIPQVEVGQYVQIKYKIQGAVQQHPYNQRRLRLVWDGPTIQQKISREQVDESNSIDHGDNYGFQVSVMDKSNRRFKYETIYIDANLVDLHPLNQYSHFYSIFEKELTSKYEWHLKHTDGKKYECVPLSPYLFWSYLMDPRNAQVISSELKSIIDHMKEYVPELFVDWEQTPFTKPDQHKSVDPSQGKTLIALAKELQNLSDPAHITVTSTKAEMDGGGSFTNSGHVLFLMFLGLVIHRHADADAEGEIANLIKFVDGKVPKRREDLYLQAYEWVARVQEKALVAQWQSHYLSYTFIWSEDKEKLFPFSLAATAPQSLRNLNMRHVEPKHWCSACAEKYTTYHGDSSGLFHRGTVDSDNANGICVESTQLAQNGEQFMNGYILTEDEQKYNGDYRNFIGTWQQMQRVQNAYIKKQHEMYQNSNPHYSLVKYYVNLLYLKMDVWFRWAIGISNITEKQDTDNNWEKPEGFVENIWAMVKEIVGKLGTTLKHASWLLYKIIDVCLRMPVVRQVIVQLAEKLVSGLCVKMAVEQHNYDLLNKENDVFNDDLGLWLASDEGTRTKIANKEADAIWKTRTDRLAMFAAVIRQFGGDSAGSYMSSGILALEGFFSKAFESAVGLFSLLPGVKTLLETCGITNTAMKAMIMGGIRSQGEETFNYILKVNSAASDMLRLYDTIVECSQCSLGLSEPVIFKQGVVLGEAEPYLYYAFEQALYNIPYYAVQILNEYEYNRDEEDGASNRDTRWQFGFNREDAKMREEHMALIKKGIFGQWLVPGGDYAKETQENNGKMDAAIELRLAKLKLEKEIYLLEKKRSDEVGRRSDTEKYDFDSGGQLLTTLEQNGLIAQVKTEFKRKKAECKERYHEAIEEQQESNLYWWGGALLAAAAIGLFVATGGLAAVAGAVGSAASAAATAASAAATAVTASPIGSATATIGSFVASPFVQQVAAAGTVALTREVINASKDTPLLTALSYQGSQILYGGLKKVSDFGEHINDSYKFFSLERVFAVSDVWKMIFMEKLTEKIELFRNKTPARKRGDTKLQSIQIRERFARNKSIAIQWAGVDCDFLNLDICTNFFEHYGDMTHIF